jgi:hypothetical protein
MAAHAHLPLRFHALASLPDVQGRGTSGAIPAVDAVTVEKVEEIPMNPRRKKLAGRIFAAARKHG